MNWFFVLDPVTTYDWQRVRGQCRTAELVEGIQPLHMQFSLFSHDTGKLFCNITDCSTSMRFCGREMEIFASSPTNASIDSTSASTLSFSLRTFVDEYCDPEVKDSSFELVLCTDRWSEGGKLPQKDCRTL